MGSRQGRGSRIVADGLDGIGKGVVIAALREAMGGEALDVDAFEHERDFYPDFTDDNIDGTLNPMFVDPKSIDLITVSEPSYVGIGAAIRREGVQKNSRHYDGERLGLWYSEDRFLLHNRIYEPALKNGLHVLGSRCEAVSFVYQKLQGAPLEYLLSLPGNTHALENPPDLLIIPTIMNPEDLMKRLKDRSKKDQAIFENLEFQLRAKPGFESSWLRDIYESRGTVVKYIDAGISIEETRQQAADAYRSFIAEAEGRVVRRE